MTEETLEQLKQDRDAYKQAYENICVFYKQLVAANQRLAASHEAVEHQMHPTDATIAPVCCCNPVGGVHAAFCPCDRISG